MNITNLIAALDLPASARVDQRIPKKMLVENGAPTVADKRHINEGIEDLHWLASLKPTTIGIPEYRDETREYLEIAVLSAALRPEAKAGRLAELVHRAVPYPVLLVLAGGAGLSLTLAHKRWAQNEAFKVVLDGDVEEINLAAQWDTQHTQSFLASLATSSQPRSHLLAFYQGWMDSLIAFQIAGKTGRFVLSDGPAQAATRRQALQNYQKLEEEISTLRAAAEKERQMARQVELNLEVKKTQDTLNAIREQLGQGTAL